ncbi:MAG: aspartate ammonia-lyase [Candidatus Omnitrophica bacterium]|nr:aspartate ammonia-lyase [Candidatus Omnitrophota bacterium]
MTRLEQDSLGRQRIPAGAYYGIQTHRAVQNFPISGLRMPPELTRAYGLIKKAAAAANVQLKALEARKGRAIIRACDELLAGKFDAQIVVDVYQAGAGTSFNMNINEVVANRANELLGAKRGTYRFIHPNDHVNMAQSTNDTFPTAIRLAALMKLGPLNEALGELESALQRKARAFRGIVKSGRTHLQDAVPVSLGREFGAYALALAKARAQIRRLGPVIGELGLGGTAVGTGMNAHPRYRATAIAHLRRWTGFPLRQGEDMMERTESLGDVAQLSGSLRNYSLELIRIANDLRLMSSGPNTGFGEIDLPAIQPGSSIMPGKVNPVMPEMATMVAFQVVGHDATVAMAVQAGQLELNVMMPVVAYNVLQAMALLTTSTRALARRCIEGITADAARCRALSERSLALVTALAPAIGYLNAAKVAKEALAARRSLIDVVVEHGVLSRAQAARALDPRRLAGLPRR